jgi:hypothetical protein
LCSRPAGVQPIDPMGPPELGESEPFLIQVVDRAGIRVSRQMTRNQTEPIGAFDTAELELAALDEPPAVDVEPGCPSWDPEDGDFN